MNRNGRFVMGTIVFCWGLRLLFCVPKRTIGLDSYIIKIFLFLLFASLVLALGVCLTSLAIWPLREDENSRSIDEKESPKKLP